MFLIATLITTLFLIFAWELVENPFIYFVLLHFRWLSIKLKSLIYGKSTYALERLFY